MRQNDNGWIAVDLDGTLAVYDGWQGPAIIGDPIAVMLKRVKDWIAGGREVKIFTARVSHDGTPMRQLEASIAHEAIREWCIKHVGIELQITNVKDYSMIALWDDRAVQVEKNTGFIIGKDWTKL